MGRRAHTSHARTGGRRKRSRAAAALLAAAGLTYNDWLLQFVVPTGMDQRNSYVSEVFAADQPHRVLFGGIETGTALLVTGAAALALPGVRRDGAGARWAAAGWAAVAAFGLCSLADVAWPMRCAPSREAGCPTDNAAHTLTSGSVHFALFASMAAFLCAARADPARWRRLARRTRWLLPVSMTAAILSAGPYVGLQGSQGTAQRIHLATVAVWFWLLAAELLGERPEPAPARQPGVSGERPSWPGVLLLLARGGKPQKQN
ncbi:DUF998 domain-containing protein [Streptomyces sp. NPDC059785]|uniref:DUF998 domain-containing protein n=1 Tax=unclassified Streptomyces TaxID=2593676 RepID=UPI003648BC63